LRSSIGCNPTGSIISKTFFQLPPSQAAFYRIAHASYRPVPEFDEDCTPDRRALNGRFEVTYPRAGQIISLPRYMSGQQGEVIFRATAKNDSAQLFWHLDKRYLGATRTFHELSETVLPGKHLLRVVDQQGVWQQIRFTVIP